MRFLLAAGADRTSLSNDNGPTLFYACARGHAEIVELLLTAGADPNANRDTDGPHPEGDSPVFLARGVGLDAHGVEAPYRRAYSAGTMLRNRGREVAARVRAWLDVFVLGAGR